MRRSPRVVGLWHVTVSITWYPLKVPSEVIEDVNTVQDSSSSKDRLGSGTLGAGKRFALSPSQFRPWNYWCSFSRAAILRGCKGYGRFADRDVGGP